MEKEILIVGAIVGELQVIKIEKIAYYCYFFFILLYLICYNICGVVYMQKNYKKIIKFIVLTFIFINFIGIFNTLALKKI